MFKTFGLQVRKDPLDHSGFMSHWVNVHARLSEGVEGVRGYTLNEILIDCGGGSLPAATLTPAIDGIAELWFDSREAMQAMAQTPAAKRWFGDGVNYLGARTGVAAEERLVKTVAAPRPAYKLIRLLVRHESLDMAAFRARWGGDYATAAAALAMVAGYVQSPVSAVNPATNMPTVTLAPVDGVEEFWVGSIEAGRTLASALDALEPQALFGSARSLIVAETVIVTPPF